MRRLLLALWLAPALASAQEAPAPLDLESFCAGRSHGAAGGAVRLVESEDGVLAFLDGGFCSAYLESLKEDSRDSARPKPNPALDALRLMAPAAEAAAVAAPPKPRWKVRLYASNSFTTYFRSDIVFKSSRYDLTVKDYQWAERSSREYFNPKTWREPGNNPLQIFDEPTNTFVVSIERGGHEFFLSAFHPKFLQAPDQVKDMKGTIDGAPVNGFAPINKPFDGYDQTPGESKLVSNTNTHKQMAFEIGYGHRFMLFDSRFGSISYVPAVGVGVMVGANISVAIQEGKWWDFDEHGDSYGVQGFGGSLTNRVELNGPKERVGIFYENKLAYYRQEHGFLDGTQKYDLKMMGNSIGVKFMLHNPANRRKKRHSGLASFTP